VAANLPSASAAPSGEAIRILALRAARYRSARRKRFWGGIGAFLLLLVGGFGSAAWSEHRRLAMRADPAVQKVEQSVYYRNCDAARAAGTAPIHEGQPGYRPELDADSDGIAREPWP
jgi:hypothetical protein